MRFQASTLTLSEGQRLYNCLAQIRLAGQRQQPDDGHFCCRQARIVMLQSPSTPSLLRSRHQLRCYGASPTTLKPSTADRIGGKDDESPRGASTAKHNSVETRSHTPSISAAVAKTDKYSRKLREPPIVRPPPIDLLSNIIQAPDTWLSRTMREAKDSKNIRLALENAVDDLFNTWRRAVKASKDDVPVHWSLRVAEFLCDLGKRCVRGDKLLKLDAKELQRLAGKHMHSVLDVVESRMKHGEQVASLQETLYKCLRTMAFCFQRRDQEASLLLGALLQGQAHDKWVLDVEKVKEAHVRFRVQKHSDPSAYYLSEAVSRWVQMYVDRIYDIAEGKFKDEWQANRRRELAEQAIEWASDHPNLFRFHHFLYPVVSRGLRLLLSKIDDPVPFLQDRMAKLGKEKTQVLASAFCRNLLNIHAPFPAYKLYRWAKEEGVSLDEVCIRKLIRLLNFKKEHVLSVKVSEEALQSDPTSQSAGLQESTLTTIVWARARQKDEKEMEDLLRMIALQSKPSEREQVESMAFQARLLCYTRMEDVKRVTRLVETRYDLQLEPGQTSPSPGLLYPDYGVMARLVQTLLGANMVDEAEDMLRRMIKLGHRPSTNLLNDILHFYVKRDSLAMTISLLKQMTEAKMRLNVRTYTTVMTLFARRGSVENVALLIKAMKTNKIQPDSLAYTTLLNAHVEAANWQGAIDIFTWMLHQPELRLRPSTGAYNTMIKAYLLCGSPVQDVFAFFKQMVSKGMEPDKYTYTLILQSVADAGFMHLAEDVFNSIEQRLGGMQGSKEGKGANLWHFTIMIQGYLRVRQLSVAREYAEEVRKRNSSASSGVLWGVLIKAYASMDDGGRLESSHRLVQSAHFSIPKQYAHAYQPLIQASSKVARPDQIEALFEELQDKEAEIPYHFWVSLLDSFRREENLEAAMEMWNMILDFGMEKTKERETLAQVTSQPIGRARGKVLPSQRNLLCLPLSIIIDLLTKLGRHESVAEVWLQCRKAGFAFDRHNWNGLAVSLLHAGRMREALMVIERVLDATPPNSQGGGTREEVMTRSRDRGGERRLAQGDHGISQPEDVPISSAIVRSTPSVVQPDELTSSPSRPPNRRHANRAGDDPNVANPIQKARQNKSRGREEEEGEEGEEAWRQREEGFDEEEDGEWRQREGLEMEESYQGEEVLNLLETQVKTETVQTSWYAHFDTMMLLTETIQEAKRANGMFRVDEGPLVSASALVHHFPRVEQLLDIFARKLDAIQESNWQSEIRGRRREGR